MKHILLYYSGSPHIYVTSTLMQMYHKLMFCFAQFMCRLMQQAAMLLWSLCSDIRRKIADAADFVY